MMNWRHGLRKPKRSSFACVCNTRRCNWRILHSCAIVRRDIARMLTVQRERALAPYEMEEA